MEAHNLSVLEWLPIELRAELEGKEPRELIAWYHDAMHDDEARHSNIPRLLIAVMRERYGISVAEILGDIDPIGSGEDLPTRPDPPTLH